MAGSRNFAPLTNPRCSAAPGGDGGRTGRPAPRRHRGHPHVPLRRLPPHRHPLLAAARLLQPHASACSGGSLLSGQSHFIIPPWIYLNRHVFFLTFLITFMIIDESPSQSLSASLLCSLHWTRTPPSAGVASSRRRETTAAPSPARPPTPK